MRKTKKNLFFNNTKSSKSKSRKPIIKRWSRLGRLQKFFVPVLAILIFATAGAAYLASTRAAADPLSCTGYPEKRVFLETQTWWTPTPGTTGKNDFGHLHLGTCFPYKQALTGTVDFDVRLMMHDNPGKAFLFRVGTEDVVLGQQDFDMTCSVATCEKWLRVSLDTTKASHDGRNEFRFSVKLNEPDGNVMFESSGWQAYLKNGKASSDYRSSDVTIARGWYTGALYTNAEITSDIPLTPVSGIWSPAVKLTAGAGGIPVTHWSWHVDPSFHAVPANPGTITAEGSGELRSTIKIDTTKLTNGTHRLVLISSADCMNGNCGDVSLDGQRNSGVLSIPFTVLNGTSSTDTTAPTVTLTAPANGATVGDTVNVSASASDNVGVSKVDFYAGNTLIGSDTSGPYSIPWSTGQYANGTYTLIAKAYDMALNQTTSNTVNVNVQNTTSGGGGGATTTNTFNPVADAHVNEGSRTSNYGRNTGLRIRNTSSSDYRTYLQFNVSGLSAAPRGAKLRLYVTDDSPSGGNIYLVANNWTEEAITWSNAPLLSGSSLSSVLGVKTGSWAEFDLKNSITGNGTFSYVIESASSNSAVFSSKEGTYKPQLVVTP